ncbi:hypothetical protein EV127DRAFT_516953 [Xylaria flabelliformis]|nr:hypothetical protein EV127DRAFT_516953 [Xylaria flabelliformis]
MSNTDRGGGHDGDRGRQPNRPGRSSSDRTKRNRSVSTDDNNSSERSSAINRRDLQQYQVERLQSIRQAHSIEGTVTMLEGKRRMPLAQGVNLSVGSPADVTARMRHANPHSTWVYGQIQPTMMANIITYNSRDPRKPILGDPPVRPLDNSARRARAARMLEEQQVRAERELVGDRCAICNSFMHDAKRCPALVGPGPFEERHEGFKKWCPHHLTTSHSMDQCKQRWTWLRDAKKVTEMLVENCGAGPAFATNLLDWRCLLDTLPPNMAITVFPWTPEYALVKKRDEPNFHDRNIRELDGHTLNVRTMKEIKIWQTENGEEPEFDTFEDLREHAEKEYQKFQQQIEKNRERAAKDTAEFEEAAKKLQELAEKKKALLHQYANNPKLLKRFDRIAAHVASVDVRQQTPPTPPPAAQPGHGGSQACQDPQDPPPIARWRKNPPDRTLRDQGTPSLSPSPPPSKDDIDDGERKDMAREQDIAGDEDPELRTFDQLSAHAEKEYQKSQQEMNRKRQLAAKKEEDDARVIEEFKRIFIQRQSFEKQEKALLQQHANDPELMRKLDRIVEMASLENCKQEDVESKIKKVNDKQEDVEIKIKIENDS